MKHIPGSINIDARSLFDPELNILLSANDLTSIFENAGLKKEDRIITYCVGSIAGSCVAFVLYWVMKMLQYTMDQWRNGAEIPVNLLNKP
jgi:thiosulfate/3-mercaptopyruvate sulfurtransferase